jgi:hypothetical protein
MLFKNTSLELLHPSAFPVAHALFFIPAFTGTFKLRTLKLKSASLRVWLPFLRFELSFNLYSIFQLPTLLGFSLQSFFPFE